jgi:hypothetical protein
MQSIRPGHETLIDGKDQEIIIERRFSGPGATATVCCSRPWRRRILKKGGQALFVAALSTTFVSSLLLPRFIR